MLIWQCTPWFGSTWSGSKRSNLLHSISALQLADCKLRLENVYHLCDYGLYTSSKL